MAMNIRNRRAESLAEEVARRTGETKTQAITALQERLARISRERRGAPLADELTAIARECAALPVRDAPGAEAILGYGEAYSSMSST